MGGVLIEPGNSHALPGGRLDWRGRQALLVEIAAAGGRRLTLEDLDELLFRPWRVDYELRRERGDEASFAPHLERLRQAARVDLGDFELLAAWFEPYGEQLAPIAGARRAVGELAELGLPMTVVSNVPVPGAHYRRVLERVGLAEAFVSLHFSYDSGSRKPSPLMLRAALTDLQLPATATLMVGDRDSDVIAGRAAGTGTVRIEGEEPAAVRADFTIGALADLPRILRR